MTFKLPRFRMPDYAFEHVMDLDDVLQDFDVEDVLKVLADQNSDFSTTLADFLDKYYDGGLDSFYFKAKK